MYVATERSSNRPCPKKSGRELCLVYAKKSRGVIVYNIAN